MPDYSEVRMPPERYIPPGHSAAVVWPNRCPAGHRHDPHGNPPVQWLHSPPRPGDRRHTWSCLTCEPRAAFAPDFPATPDLYDDLDWWFDPWQAEQREKWRTWRLTRG